MEMLGFVLLVIFMFSMFAAIGFTIYLEERRKKSPGWWLEKISEAKRGLAAAEMSARMKIMEAEDRLARLGYEPDERTVARIDNP